MDGVLLDASNLVILGVPLTEDSDSEVELEQLESDSDPEDAEWIVIDDSDDDDNEDQTTNAILSITVTITKVLGSTQYKRNEKLCSPSFTVNVDGSFGIAWNSSLHSNL